MLRRVIDAATRGVAWMRRGQSVRPPGGVVKVNLGCGLSVAEGWINVDSSLNAFVSRLPAPILRRLYRIAGAKQWYSEGDYVGILKGHRFVHHNLEYGLPFPDGSIDYLYSSHFLEHLFKEDAERLAREALRVLKPGGRIRIAVPDLEYAVALYREGRKEQALEYFFTPSRFGLLGDHKYMYDFELLQSLLHRAGFRDVRRRAYREGDVPDLDVLDNRPEETLFVEAAKEPVGAAT